jgi:hypothetical protein
MKRASDPRKFFWSSMKLMGSRLQWQGKKKKKEWRGRARFEKEFSRTLWLDLLGLLSLPYSADM